MKMKPYKPKNRVTRLNKIECRLTNGVTFTIVNDFDMDATPNLFDAAYQSWIARTDKFTANSFVKYVKAKEPNRIFLKLEDFEKITKGKMVAATKEEWEQENN